MHTGNTFCYGQNGHYDYITGNCVIMSLLGTYACRRYSHIKYVWNKKTKALHLQKDLNKQVGLQYFICKDILFLQLLCLQTIGAQVEFVHY